MAKGKSTNKGGTNNAAVNTEKKTDAVKTEKPAAAKKIGITETILRDAHQSLAATRMTTEEMLPVLPLLDKIGFHSL